MSSSSSKPFYSIFYPSKRPKILSISSPSSIATSLPKTLTSKSSTSNIHSSSIVVNSSPPSNLSEDHDSRIEIKKFVAKAKRNLSICSEKIEKSKAEGLHYVKLEELLVEESWAEVVSDEFNKPYAKNLCAFLEREMCGSVPIFPPQPLIFNALNSTPFDSVKVVIIGQDPYHGPDQAMGLSFSVPEGIKVPSSLVNIFKELNNDVGCRIPANGNLERWAVQGVLLLNAVLTVRSHQANSHAKKGWEPFTDAIIRTISERKTGVVFLLWGNYAQQKARLINKAKHHILVAAHPSGLSAHRGFFGCSSVGIFNVVYIERWNPAKIVTKKTFLKDEPAARENGAFTNRLATLS